MKAPATDTGRAGPAREAGLTLVELLIALAMIAVVLSGMFVTLRAMLETWATGQHRVGVQQNARHSLEWITRRIRLGGQPEVCGAAPVLPIFRNPPGGNINESLIRFAASVGPCGTPVKEYEYLVDGGRLIERTYSLGATTPEAVRPLTVVEEVGIITVTGINFCYYDVKDQPLNGGTEPCTGSVSSTNLGRIFRVKIRLELVSGRAGEVLVLRTQATPRLVLSP
ncbi:MAG: prepilin-type N-terminal cleavage/methylation domain-containing protein [Armatimonadota bacterium]|nr:prepilin-type N-terminal cleavage/methylation domain-containing protein [Armatimonadota bacterium]MDR5697255.1 prepilin-type N-terminal cleavage/methylation domain-containing protein [Armatimonadota bacterium]